MPEHRPEEELNKTLEYELYGPPQLKKNERMHFLGQFRERVIFALTEEQVRHGEVPEKLIKALETPRADRMIIKGNTDASTIIQYEHLGKDYGVEVTTAWNSDFKGDIGLVVASENAVDLPDSEIYAGSS